MCVETIGKIRRRRLVQGDSISAIARDLKLARNTVKKALCQRASKIDQGQASNIDQGVTGFFPGVEGKTAS